MKKQQELKLVTLVKLLKLEKAGKKEFTFKGKKYNTRVKGEKEKKPLIEGKGFFGKKINISKPELSGKTSKKIKKFVRGDTKVLIFKVLEKVA